MTTESEARKELEGDTNESLKASFEEYCEGKPMPSNRKDVIAAIIMAMKEEGHITTGTVKLSDIARDMGINPKVARDKMRRAQSKGQAPQSSKSAGWVFDTNDRTAVEAIIKRKDHGEL